MDDELRRALAAGRVERLEQEEMPSWAEPEHLSTDEYVEEIGLFTDLVTDYLAEHGLDEQYEVRSIADRAPARPTSPLHISEDVLIVPADEPDHNYAAAVNVEYGNIWMPLGPITYRTTKEQELPASTEAHIAAEFGDLHVTETEEAVFPYDAPVDADAADRVEYAADDDQIALYQALTGFAEQWADASDHVTAPETPDDGRPYNERRFAVSFTDPRVSGPETGRYMDEHLRRYAEHDL